MKRFFQKLIGKIKEINQQNEAMELPIKHRMFRVIGVIGTAVSLACWIETIFVSSSVFLMVILGILFAFMLLVLWLSFIRKLITVASVLFALFLNVFLFPMLFLFGGGLNSGAMLWFLLGYFFIFLMFDGWRFLVHIGITIIMNVCVYIFAMAHPDMVIEPESVRASYLDSLYSVIAVGVSIGLLLRIVIRMYQRQQKIANERAIELERSSRSRNNLYAGLSHEIRTPINTIMGLNELILRSNPSDEIVEYSNDIENASELLLSLVNDILDFSRIEMRQLDIIATEYKIKKLFTNLYDLIHIHANKKNLKLDFKVDPQMASTLFGDEKRIKQIALNLLSNAVKYTESGSVSLEVSGEKNPDGTYNLKMVVTDTGIGIKKEEIANIFESFQRVDERKNHHVEGNGLGLSIVKQLTDLMGGTIHVDSIYTKGSVFTVIIPQKIVEEVPVGVIGFGESKKSSYHYRQKFEAPDVRILIVDDNRINTLVTSRLLAATRMQIYTASSVKECLELTHRKAFHLILMDYIMPDMDGKEALYAIRAQDNGLCKETPIIALTATSKDEAEELQIANVFDGYLEKPISSDLLEQEILNLIPMDLVEYREVVSDYDNAEGNTAIVRKKKKVRITTDSACDLPSSVLQKHDIHVQNLYIRTEHGRYVDSVEIDTDNMSQYIAMRDVFADSCSVEEFEQFFADNLDEAEDVIHISLASNSGVTFSHAQSAAAGFDHVHVFDSGHVSCGEALLVLEAARLAGLGKPVEEILQLLQESRELVDSGFITPNAVQLSKKGFASKMTAVLTTIFHMHPMLRMKQKRVSVSGFFSGEDKRLWRKYVGFRLRKMSRIDNRLIILSFASCSSYLKSFILEEISNRISFENVIICKSSFSNAIFTGTETFGFAFYELDD